MVVLTAIFWFALGAIVGSFLNVVVYRMPAGLSVVSPGSHCPACRRPIRWFDNVPILAWLWLGGRCRDCREPIAVRYPLVEFVTAVLFLSIGWPHTAGCFSRGEVADRRPGSADATVAAPAEPSSSVIPGMPTADESAPITDRLRGAAAVAIVHLLLLSTLLAAALIAYDGGPTPRRLFLPAWIVAPLAYAPEWSHSVAVYAGIEPWRAWQPVLGAAAGVLGGWGIELAMRLCMMAPIGAAVPALDAATDRAAEPSSARLLSAIVALKSASRSSPPWALGCLGIVCGWAITLGAGAAALVAALTVAASRRRDGRAAPIVWAGGLFFFAWVWLAAAAWR